MDNDIGYEKTDINKQYVRKLKDKYNIVVEWQIPHLPDSNVLGLRVKMGLQSKFEAYHRLKVMNKDVLAESV